MTETKQALDAVLTELRELAHDLDQEAKDRALDGLDPSCQRELRDKLRAIVKRYGGKNG